jgi:hypothetical protein
MGFADIQQIGYSILPVTILNCKTFITSKIGSGVNGKIIIDLPSGWSEFSLF